MILNLIFVGLIFLLTQLFHGHTLELILNIVSVGLVSTGIFFFLGTAIGFVRFPDFYTRMHAAGKGDTLSSILILLGVAVHTLNAHHLTLGTALVALKLLLITNFVEIGSPTATHALMNAGYKMKVPYWKKGKKAK